MSHRVHSLKLKAARITNYRKREREGETDRQTQTGRETETERERETDRQTDRQIRERTRTRKLYFTRIIVYVQSEPKTSPC